MSLYVRYSPIALGGGAVGVFSMGTFDSQAGSADGAVIVGSQLFMQSATSLVPGLVNIGTQTFGGNKTFTGTIVASNLSGTNTGNVTLAAVGSSPSANGASLSGQILTLQPFDSTHPGVVTASGGGTTNFARADGSWAAPAGSTPTAPTSIGAFNNSSTANGLDITANVLTLHAADATNPGALSTGTQQIAGIKQFITGIISDYFSSDITNPADAGVVRLANNDSISWRNFTNGSNKSLFLNTSDIFQLGAGLVISGNVSASNLSGTNTGDVTLAAVGASPNANGASLSGQVLTLQPADGTNPGAVSTTTQTFAGVKTFSASGYAVLVTNSLGVGTTSAITSGTEQLSVLATITANSTSRSLVAANQVNIVGASSTGHRGITGLVTRKVTADTTDTGNYAAGVFTVQYDVTGGVTLTNTGTIGFSAITVDPLTSLTAGTLATNFYTGLTFNTETQAVTGRKQLVKFFQLSGGTVGNAFITDNGTFTGDWFLNSTNTNPSLLSGQLRLGTSTSIFSSGAEQFSSLYTISSDPGATAYGVVSEILNTTTTAFSRSLLAVRGTIARTITADTTDTAGMFGPTGSITINTAAHVYTNNATTASACLRALSLTLNGGGSYVGNHSQLLLDADSVAVTGYKTAVHLLGVSGGTLGNALIADNRSFSGSYAINLTTASPSVITTNLQHGGTATNDSASAGFVGEYIESLVTSPTSVPTSGQFGDAANVVLTAGDWEITAMLTMAYNGATVTVGKIGISTTSGNSSTGLQDGVNLAWMVIPNSTADRTSTVPGYRVSLSGGATVYLKLTATYTVATPTYLCRISARRMR